MPDIDVLELSPAMVFRAQEMAGCNARLASLRREQQRLQADLEAKRRRLEDLASIQCRELLARIFMHRQGPPRPTWSESGRWLSLFDDGYLCGRLELRDCDGAQFEIRGWLAAHPGLPGGSRWQPERLVLKRTTRRYERLAGLKIASRAALAEAAAELHRTRPYATWAGCEQKSGPVDLLSLFDIEFSPGLARSLEAAVVFRGTRLAVWEGRKDARATGVPAELRPFEISTDDLPRLAAIAQRRLDGIPTGRRRELIAWALERVQ